MKKNQESKPFGVIYMWENLVNGHIYIGQSRSPKQRKRDHIFGTRQGSLRKNNSLIHNAIKKYGEDNFSYSIVKKCDSRDEMNYWEKFYIKEFNSKVPNGYNVMDGGFKMKDYSKSDRHEKSKKLQGRQNLKSKNQYLGVRPYSKGKGFSCIAGLNGESFSKAYPSEIEAAEAYDCVILHIYGRDAKINFPEKLEDYLKLDLLSIYTNFATRRRPSSKFKLVRKSPIDGRWEILTTFINNKPQSIYPGSFLLEEEAAKLADKFMFLYNDTPIEELNFPELAHDFDKEELKKSLKKYFYECVARHKTIRGVRKTLSKWETYISYKNFFKKISIKHLSQEEAGSSLKEYLNEFVKDAPSVENLKNIHLTSHGKYFIENKNSLDEALSLRLERLHEHFTRL